MNVLEQTPQHVVNDQFAEITQNMHSQPEAFIGSMAVSELLADDISANYADLSYASILGKKDAKTASSDFIAASTNKAHTLSASAINDQIYAMEMQRFFAEQDELARSDEDDEDDDSNN